MTGFQWFSIPFFIFGFVFLLILIFQLPIISIFLGIGVAALCIYAFLGSLFYYRFHKEKTSITNEFNTPYYRRCLKLKGDDLYFVNDILTKKSPDLMDQFIYECYGKGADLNLEIASMLKENKINRKKIKEKVSKKSVSVDISKVEYEKSDINQNLLGKKLKDKEKSKYLSFLED